MKTLKTTVWTIPIKNMKKLKTCISKSKLPTELLHNNVRRRGQAFDLYVGWTKLCTSLRTQNLLMVPRSVGWNSGTSSVFVFFLIWQILEQWQRWVEPANFWISERRRSLLYWRNKNSKRWKWNSEGFLLGIFRVQSWAD